MGSDTLFIAGMFAVTALLIAGNALFVFHEFAFVMLKPFHIRQLTDSSSWLAQTISKAANRLDHYIAVDQLGITATSLGVGWIGQPALTRLLRGPFENVELFSGVVAVASFAISFTVLTMLQMVFGELIPKTIALRHPGGVAAIVSLPVEAFAWLFHPLVVLLNGLGNLAVRAVGASPGAGGHREDLPAEELEAVIRLSLSAGRVQTDPLVVRRTLHFSDLEARDLIVPRQEMVTVDLSMSLERVLEIAKENHFTRYPVSDGSSDRIVGLLNVKDLFQIDEHERPMLVADWHQAIRDIPVLPEAASIEQVLERFIEEREQMVLLVDEFGGTTGLLTVADIAAEATGSSRDITLLHDGAFLIRGETAVSTVESVLDLSLDAERRDYETMAGLIMSVLGRIPVEGDIVNVNRATIRVHRMRERRVVQVVLRAPQSDEPVL